MKIIYQIFGALVAINCIAASNEPHFLSDEFIDSINKAQSSWIAGRNFPADTQEEHLSTLLGHVTEDISEILPEEPFHLSNLKAIPENFDSRNEWPHCAKSIGHIRDQAGCGSCWAVSTTSAMTDRTCIASGHLSPSISAADLMSCDPNSDGCNGGSMAHAWLYWVKQGITYGGDYGSNEGCIDYSFPSCRHGNPNSTKPPCNNETTPACQSNCNFNTTVSKSTLLSFGKKAKYVRGAAKMQEAILTDGPITSFFKVYEDFFSYKSGVYQYVKGNFSGLHAVKIIGWGVENTTPYWLIANSWNEEWGDNGFFKIRRGTNECEIDIHAATALPV